MSFATVSCTLLFMVVWETSEAAACEAVSGYTPDELLLMSFPPLIVPDDLDRTVHHFKLAAQGTPQNYEIEIFHKSGRRIPIHVTNVPIVVDGIVASLAGGWLGDYLLPRMKSSYYLVSAVSMALGVPVMIVALFTRSRIMVPAIACR